MNNVRRIGGHDGLVIEPGNHLDIRCVYLLTTCLTYKLNAIGETCKAQRKK